MTPVSRPPNPPVGDSPGSGGYDVPIDVRYEPDHEAPGFVDEGGRPMLVWERDPKYGQGWTLYYLEDPESKTSTVDREFVGGDVRDVEWAIEQARRQLQLLRTEGTEYDEGGES